MELGLELDFLNIFNLYGWFTLQLDKLAHGYDYFPAFEIIKF